MRIQLTPARIAALIALAVVAGLLFAWSGLYNVAATAGHWPVTGWLLHYTMRNSVETHTLAIAAPPLVDPALIHRGAAHYENGCAPCHGAPGRPGNDIPKNMLPEPPYLPAIVADWSAEELFWIVRHGFKYTGMPAWPAQSREDEVWAVTAFLQELPAMTPEEYVLLSEGPDLDAGAASGAALFSIGDASLLAACANCHGADGVGRLSGAFPRLDIHSPEYLTRALNEYASGVRPSGFMQPVAGALAEEEMEGIALHYGRREEPPSAAQASNQASEPGYLLATEGIAERQIPPCSGCHGLHDGPADPLYPTLAGQYASFILEQLQLWKQNRRGGSAYSAIMAPIAARMTDEEMQAVADYYESLGPAAE
jgi:cytochrome c553